MEEFEYFLLFKGNIEKKIAKFDINSNEINIGNPNIINQIIKDYTIFINSFKNKCIFLHTKDIEKMKYTNDKTIVDFFITPNSDNLQDFVKIVENKNTEKWVSFIFTITYDCNLRCSYCYQQHDKYLKRQLITETDLKAILSIIEKFILDYPDWSIDLGLFGGEPLLPENEKIIDMIFDFCKKYRLQIDITTNGCFLKYYLKKLIIYRNFISGINLTVDSSEFNENTRKSLKHTNYNTGIYILGFVKLLIEYGVFVNLSSNIDLDTIYTIEDTYLYLKNNEYIDNENFRWSIGRVDDRLYETNYPKIISETRLILEVLKLREKYNTDKIIPAFIKSTYNLCNFLGLNLNQYEFRGTYNYCWASSNKDKVYYIDNDLNVFRCTYTVGRNKFKKFLFSKNNLYVDLNKDDSMTYLDYKECIDCKYGGLCSGGCKLSHSVNFKKMCDYEKENIDEFLNLIFKEKFLNILEKLNGKFAKKI